jgi:hypothetical protein
MPTTVRAKAGDCIASLAAEHGFRDYLTVWNANAALQGNRQNPNMLVVNDAVDLPDRKKRVKKNPQQTWTFEIKKKQPVKLRVVLLGPDGNPLKDAKWELTWKDGADDKQKKGKTKANGLIRIKNFSPTATEAKLKVVPKKPDPPPPVVAAPLQSPPPYPAPIKPEQFKDKVRKRTVVVKWTLAVGSLAPPDTLDGVQARLHNLGAKLQIGDDDTKTTPVVKAYQKAFLNDANGSGLHADIQADLKDRHDKAP